jgi:hypothetical protein
LDSFQDGWNQYYPTQVNLLRKRRRQRTGLRHANLYAFRGHFHFIDAQGRWLIEDGKPIAT